jgi:tetratricopeptide (TPR) repeat protein
VLDHKLTVAHGNLGVALRMKGDLPGAIAAYQRAAELEPANPWHWYQFAQARLTAGDREGYRKVCADMLNRFEKTRDAAVAATVLYTCLPVADALDDMARLAPLGELAATDKANARLLGAALYRAGQYEAAIEPLNQGQSRAWDHLFLAMAHQRLGRTEKAREYLKRAVEQIKTARYPWPESVESEQLRREAEAVLGI